MTARLAWTSDQDADIGTGGSFSKVLSDGSHTITASVTDSGAETGSASITITVGSAPPPPPPPLPPSNQVVPSGVSRIGAAPGSSTYTGVGIGVAIVDSGIDFGHPDIAANVAALCFTTYVDCQDDLGHGTHVAGIVAALNNDIDVVGVAPEATIYAVKVLDENGDGTWDDVVAGLDWVLANQGLIQVVNMSLGSKAFDGDDFIGIAIKSLHDAGISVVVSAGNDRNDEITDRVPARFPDVMAIASSTALGGGNNAKGQCRSLLIEADTASYFTTDGAGVTISAPGASHENIAKGCFIEGVGIESLNLGGGTVRMSGTSMAAPHVAGVVALMWDKADDTGAVLDPEAARNRIHNNADRTGIASLDSLVGGYTFDGVREGILDAAGALK